jgi:enoyl-CoA hydratase
MLVPDHGGDFGALLGRKLGAGAGLTCRGLSGVLIPVAALSILGILIPIAAFAVHARADAIATAIAAKSPIGLARVKQIVEHAFDMSESAGLALEQALSNLHTTSFDRSEGLAAFRERRKPNFLGQ